MPTRFGTDLFDALQAAANALSGCAYGMEALNVLRVEKGFITHAEIHGRVTADDVGLGKMVRAKGLHRQGGQRSGPACWNRGASNWWG